MPVVEFQSLKASIEAIGIQNPITIFNGMVIDGWHRYTAANEVGISCPLVELHESIDPREFVLAQNKNRRHITQAQLALAAASVYSWITVGRPNNSALSAEYSVKTTHIDENNFALPAELIKTTKELAIIAGVGTRSIEQAKTVIERATPAVQAAVKNGEVGLVKAAKIALLPQSEQAEALTRPVPKVEKIENPEDDYTVEDSLKDQICDLQSELAIANIQGSDDDRDQAKNLILELKNEIRILQASLKVITQSRDAFQDENAELKKQIIRQRREIDKVTGKRTA